MKNLTIKQENFCKEIASGKSQSDAYRLAYNTKNMKDETINSKAYLLMEKGYIRARVDEIRKPVVKAAQLTLETHLADLLRIREAAIEDRSWSAAVSAEATRGKAAGLHITKLDVTEDKELIVNIVRYGDNDEEEILEENIHGR